MIRIAWKQILIFGFIFSVILTGCGDKDPPVDELLVQAETMLDAGQIGNAILVLERCQELAPDRVDVLEALAFAHSANQDPMLASLTFCRIVELVPSRPEYLLYSAESLLEAGETQLAVDQYAKYLEVRPEDRAIHVTLSGLYEETGALNKAIESMLAAERIEPRPQQEITIGRLYLQKENLAQAQAWYARAIDGGSEFRDEGLLGLLETAVRAKRFKDAEALLGQLDAEYPGRLDRSNLDNVRDQLQVWRQRQDAAKEAVAALERERVEISPGNEDEQEAIDPDTPAGSIADEVIASEMPEPEPEPTGDVQADPEPEESVAIDTMPEPELGPLPADLAEEHLQAARQLREEGSLQEAIREYKQALILFDQQPLIWAELSETYLEAGNGRWAQATASEAVRRDPENPRLVLQFLRASRQNKQGNRLIREMEDAYRKFPNNLDIILVLARTYRDLGSNRNASLLYGKFLELAPRGHPEWTRVMAELESLGTR